jgi:hypothetical protein
MDANSLIYVPIAIMAVLVAHRAVRRSNLPNSHRTPVPQQWVAAVLPLIWLLVWVGLCLGVKLLTWKPFAGDSPGSVELTNFLLLAGSTLAGAWISARLRQQQATPKA